VPVLATGAIDGLVERLGREHAEDDRYTRIPGGLRDPSSGFARDELEVCRLTADHGTQTDHGIIGAARREPSSDERDLERPGGPRDVDVFLPHAVFGKA